MSDDMRDLNNVSAELAKFAVAPDWTAAAKGLLNELGYDSARTLKPFRRVADFLETFPNDKNPNTGGEKRFIAAVQSVQIIFQLTADEIENKIKEADGQSSFLDEKAKFDEGNISSFLFVAVELKKGELSKGGYSRGKYAEWTREINKRFGMPVVVLFGCADADNATHLTLAFVGRRKNMTDESRDVLQKVSLLREIHCTKPHRGHLDILAALSFTNRLNCIKTEKFEKNFDGLLKAWLHELDADALNKRFYDDLLAWFKFAVVRAKFPSPSQSPVRNEEHVIRIINRILFIWFLKEKGLVAAELFMETQIEPLLKDYEREGDSYYRAVLQNLFFATLNTSIMTADGKRHRRFRTDGDDKTDFNKQYKVFSLRRYENLIAAPAQLEKYLDESPFVNSGLFDCLDNDADKGAGGRVDCFSDNLAHRKLLCVPNYLFFGGDGAHKGLFDILQKYKFTVEENTPIEQEVALDPELLGKVFENLLVYLNRKATGSYYTPRDIVDYMVRESLLAHFCDKMRAATSPRLTEKLKYLLTAETDYEGLGDGDKLSKDEIVRFVELTGELKLLDPAVGSGAFPMGVLSQLTMALIRIDPKNVYLRKREMKKAKAFVDAEIREQAICNVEEVFSAKNQFNNYGRKLSLIQSSIFGVDIQPAAVQICRLRFFIALAIEQIANADADDNYGIRPLPNLETKIIAADTLIKLKSADIFRGSEEIKSLEEELQDIRREFFGATDRKTKKMCIAQDAEKRRELSDKLKALKYPKGDAERIAKWDLYDQTKFAGWFNAKWMFGADDGFDVIIGNPPYVQLQADGGRLGTKYEKQRFDCFAKTSDIYALFYEQGINLLKQGGYLCYITSNKWMRADYGKKLRGFFATKNPVKLLDFGSVKIFESVTVDNNILIIQKNNNGKNTAAVQINTDYKKGDDIAEYFNQRMIVLSDLNADAWVIGDKNEKAIKTKIDKIGTPIKDWDVDIKRGVTTGLNDAFIIDKEKRDELIAADSKSAKIIKPILRGRDIKRYHATWMGLYIIVTDKDTDIEKYPAVKQHLMKCKPKLIKRAAPEAKYWFALQATAYHANFEKEKIIWSDISAHGCFVYDTKKLYLLDTAFIMTGDDLKYLLAILNSRLISWYMPHVAVNLGETGIRWKKIYVEKLPIPQIPKAKQLPFVKLAEKITAAKAANSAVATGKLESEIDQLVYELYGLTKKEIAIVEAKNNPPK